MKLIFVSNRCSLWRHKSIIKVITLKYVLFIVGCRQGNRWLVLIKDLRNFQKNETCLLARN